MNIAVSIIGIQIFHADVIFRYFIPKEGLCTVFSLPHKSLCTLHSYVVIHRTQTLYFHTRLLPQKFQGMSIHG